MNKSRIFVSPDGGIVLRRQHGVALLEALIAILLFSIGILGMAALQGKAAKLGTDAEDRTTASLLTDEAVAMMWAEQSTSLSTAASTAWQSKITASGLAGATGTIGAPDAQSNVTILIQWTPVSRAASSAGVKTAQFFTKVNMPQ